MFHNEQNSGERPSCAENFRVKSAERAAAFHRSFPEYEPTPLLRLNSLAGQLGLDSIYIKDESRRFGLNAFKVLGGSYAVGNYIAERLGEDISALPFERLCSKEVKARLGDMSFSAATDGNHGRGVAWTAKRLGFKSFVFMPKGSKEERLENIRAAGAEAWITDMSYDDTVRFVRSESRKRGWVQIQDTAWEGYEKIPRWIMEGYCTMGLEMLEQLGGEVPTHIFLQAGVGSMAGSMAAFFADAFGSRRPVISIVEPERADCFYRTAEAGDGRLHFSEGPMDTIMAGLACGEPCPAAWEILRAYGDNFISMSDRYAALGMRVLGNPLPGDRALISGESGAAAFGAAYAVLTRPELAKIKEELQLDGSSKILCISTEGATDSRSYRQIVWEGRYPAAD
ncbi:MAG: diaminopropionate ammonia-lyase [Candidatus Limivicinus sp.]